jgi:hypothetical protein
MKHLIQILCIILSFTKYIQSIAVFAHRIFVIFVVHFLSRDFWLTFDFLFLSLMHRQRIDRFILQYVRLEKRFLWNGSWGSPVKKNLLFHVNDAGNK